MKHILLLTRIYDRLFVKKCFMTNTGGSFLDMKHILVLTRIYDRMFVKKVFCEKHRRIFFGYETYFSTYLDI